MNCFKCSGFTRDPKSTCILSIETLKRETFYFSLLTNSTRRVRSMTLARSLEFQLGAIAYSGKRTPKSFKGLYFQILRCSFQITDQSLPNLRFIQISSTQTLQPKFSSSTMRKLDSSQCTSTEVYKNPCQFLLRD